MTVETGIETIDFRCQSVSLLVALSDGRVDHTRDHAQITHEVEPSSAPESQR